MNEQPESPADQIEGYISLRHETVRGEWALFFEFQPGTGSSATSGRRWDALAVSCWGATKGHRICYEVKRTRSDFLRELANREKRDLAERLCHETWFCCYPKVCAVEEVPDGWGLMTVSPETGAVHYPRAARARSSVETPDSFVAALARRGAEEGRPTGRCWPKGVWKFSGREVPEAELRAFCDGVSPGIIASEVAKGIREERAKADRLESLRVTLLHHFGAVPTEWQLREVLQAAARKTDPRAGDLAARLRTIAAELEKAS